MATRTSFFSTFRIAAFCVSLATPLAVPGLASTEDDVVQPEVENSRNRFLGEITGSAVQIRSGPGGSYYATQKLEKGVQVTVVGIKADWLKIVPPEGSFSYVGKAYVDRRKDGQVGRINSNLAVVRAGSTMNLMKFTPQVRPPAGTDVTILGEQEEYYKIVPPDGAYVYVNKQFVKPVRPLDNPDALAPEGENGGGIVAARGKTPAISTVQAVSNDPSAEAAGESASARTAEQAAAGPATRPAAESADAVAHYEKLEADFEAASAKDVTDQPLPELLEGYEKLMKTGGLPEGSRRVAEARLAAIKIRTDARDQFLAVRKTQAESAERRKALQAEQEEIDQRIKQTGVAVYTAVGTLRVSSLQAGDTTLYRLTDPATGRTVVYIRTNDPEYVSKLNTFVGVRGEVGTDARLNLKVITPTETAAVDQAKVNTTVLAQIVPASLVPGATASTGQE